MESTKDFSLIRAMADSEALRLKYSDNKIPNLLHTILIYFADIMVKPINIKHNYVY